MALTLNARLSLQLSPQPLSSCLLSMRFSTSSMISSRFPDPLGPLWKSSEFGPLYRYVLSPPPSSLVIVASDVMSSPVHFELPEQPNFCWSAPTILWSIPRKHRVCLDTERFRVSTVATDHVSNLTRSQISPVSSQEPKTRHARSDAVAVYILLCRVHSGELTQ